MKKDDLTVGGAVVSDSKDYADEHVKIDSKPHNKRNATHEDLRKTTKSKNLLTMSGKLEKSLLAPGSSEASGGFNLFTHQQKR